MSTVVNDDGSITFKVYIHTDPQYPDEFQAFGYESSQYVLLDTVEINWNPPKQEVIIPIVVQRIEEKITEVQAEAQSAVNLLNEQIQKLLSIGYAGNSETDDIPF